MSIGGAQQTCAAIALPDVDDPLDAAAPSEFATHSDCLAAATAPIVFIGGAQQTCAASAPSDAASLSKWLKVTPSQSLRTSTNQTSAEVRQPKASKHAQQTLDTLMVSSKDAAQAETADTNVQLTDLVSNVQSDRDPTVLGTFKPCNKRLAKTVSNVQKSEMITVSAQQAGSTAALVADCHAGTKCLKGPTVNTPQSRSAAALVAVCLADATCLEGLRTCDPASDPEPAAKRAGSLTKMKQMTPTGTLESVEPVAGPALGWHGGAATSVVPERSDKDGESENPQLQRPLASPQVVAPVMGQTVHLFIDKTTEGSRDGPWSGVAAPKVRDDYVSMIPNISAESANMLEALGPSITDFHERCDGSSEAIGLLFSEMAKHPLPPQVTDSILGLTEPRADLRPQRATARQLREALQKMFLPGESMEGYLATLSRHIRRLEMSYATTRAIEGLLAAFHRASAGAISALVPLLEDLAPTPILCKTMPRGMANALLRINNVASTYELTELVKLFEDCLGTEDSPALLAPILKKHISLAAEGPQMGAGDPAPGGDPHAHSHGPGVPAEGSAIEDPLTPGASWNTQAELDTLFDENEGYGLFMTDLIHKIYPSNRARDDAGSDVAATTWRVQRISESRSSVHVVLEVQTTAEIHALLANGGDCGHAFLEVSLETVNATQLMVDKILFGPDYVPEAAVPHTRPGGPGWGERLRDWLMAEDEYEAISGIDKEWEDPSTTNPRRAWTAYWDFFTALNTNVPVWINKLRRKGLSTLAAHGEALMGSEGRVMKGRAARCEKLLANKEAWNALEMSDKFLWFLHLGSVGAQVQTLLEPRISSWNVGPHGFDNSRDEIMGLFEQGDPIICLQDLRISKKQVKEVKFEIQKLFPHYWVHITTAHSNGRRTQGADGKHYNFTTLTALDSHFFPSAKGFTLHPGTARGPRRKRQPISVGRLQVISTKTKDGGKLNIINMYQFTAENIMEREELWKYVRDWVARRPLEKTILVGDLNCAGPGGREGYAHPLHSSLSAADKGLLDFCDSSDGTLTSPPGFTWARGNQRAVLDHAVSWNMVISSPKVEHLGEIHKRYDHDCVSFGLPAEDFLRRPIPTRDFTLTADKIDVVHFHSNVLKWQKRVASRISPFAPEEELADGESLMKQLLIDQDTMKDEAIELQFKQAKARRRAKERLPDRSKEQTIVRRDHGILSAAYVDATRQKRNDRVTTATTMAMKILGLPFTDKAM